MSKRIEELAVEAGAERTGYQDSEWSYSKFDHRLFGDLVLRECVKVCSDLAFSSTEPGKYMECEMAIEKHFGVE